MTALLPPWPSLPRTQTAERLFVPSTWLAVLFFVLLVAPGLLYDLLADRRRAKASESAFREVSRTVLASLIVSTISFSILVAIRWAHPAWMPDPNRLFTGKGDYVTGHYRLILRTLLIEGGIALVIAGGFQWARTRRVRARLRPVSTWTKVFREECPRGFLPYVQVRLANGMTYVGRVGYFTADLETSDRELVLVPPLYVKRPDSQLKNMASEWQRVVLSGESVEGLVVQYRPDPRSPSAGGPAKRLQRRLPWAKGEPTAYTGATSHVSSEPQAATAIAPINGSQPPEGAVSESAESPDP
jgi:Family of unknown function (DUF6338)